MNRKTAFSNNVRALAAHIGLAALSLLLFFALQGGLFLLLAFLISLAYAACGFWLLKPPDKHAVVSTLSIPIGLVLYFVYIRILLVDYDPFNLIYANPVYMLHAGTWVSLEHPLFTALFFVTAAFPPLLMWLGMVLKKVYRRMKD